MGWDLAGVVVRAAGDGTGPVRGARVVGLSTARRGWAQRVAVSTRMVAEIPDELSFADACTLPVAGLTALLALDFGGGVVGKDVLITASSGGVGGFALQLARLAGARVCAVGANPGRWDYIRTLGPDRVVQAVTEGDLFDVIIDGVGGATLGAAIQWVAADGVVVSYSGSDPEPVTFASRQFYYRAPGASIHGLIVFHEIERRGGAGRDLKRLVALAAANKLATPRAFTTSWSSYADALRQLDLRANPGKVVLIID